MRQFLLGLSAPFVILSFFALPVVIQAEPIIKLNDCYKNTLSILDIDTDKFKSNLYTPPISSKNTATQLRNAGWEKVSKIKRKNGVIWTYEDGVSVPEHTLVNTFSHTYGTKSIKSQHLNHRPDAYIKRLINHYNTGFVKASRRSKASTPYQWSQYKDKTIKPPKLMTYNNSPLNDLTEAIKKIHTNNLQDPPRIIMAGNYDHSYWEKYPTSVTFNSKGEPTGIYQEQENGLVLNIQLDTGCRPAQILVLQKDATQPVYFPPDALRRICNKINISTATGESQWSYANPNGRIDLLEKIETNKSSNPILKARERQTLAEANLKGALRLFCFDSQFNKKSQTPISHNNDGAASSGSR